MPSAHIPSEIAPNVSAMTSGGVATAPLATQDMVPPGNRIPVKTAWCRHGVSIHALVRSMYCWSLVRPVVPRIRTANWEPSPPLT